MKALIVTASRHGSTKGIADSLRDELALRGWDVVATGPQDAPPPDAFDVVILGSAIYTGRWMAEEKDYAQRHQNALLTKPVYLFSSGPLGDPPVPAEDPADAAAMKELTHARAHVTFAGRLERSELTFAEKAMVKMVKAPYGDFRPWAQVRAWADAIDAGERAPRSGE